jgi:hypothetical protein
MNLSALPAAKKRICIDIAFTRPYSITFNAGKGNVQI